ncbi:MAG TPA: FAD-dependent oxidoreductase [Streptosporangiaceae bacterium]
MPRPAIAVVGAGILGCAIAREVAARRPDVALTLLDRDLVGSGATRRSAGLHLPAGHTARIRRMAAHSEDYYRRLKHAHPELPIYPVRTTVVAPEGDISRLSETYLSRARLAPEGDLPSSAVTIPPGAGAWNVEGCQYADVYALSQALARELRRCGNVRESVRVTGLETTRDGVALRLGNGAAINVGQVVLAPGPWLGCSAWASLVAPLGLRVKKIVALHVEKPPAEHDRAIVFPDADAFLLPVPHRGHWLFSHPSQEWDVNPDDLSAGLSRDDLDEARRCLCRYAPSLADHATSGRVFCDAYSPGREPVVRALDGAGRIVFAGAANGSGYRLAPAIASEAADLLRL